MDKNVLINALIAKRLNENDNLIKSKMSEIGDMAKVLVEKAFDELNAEDSLDILLSELESEFKTKLDISAKDLSIELDNIIKKESSDLRKELIADYKARIESITIPKDGYTPVKGKDYDDGRDYILTSDDIKEIANTVVVEVPELKEKTAEEIIDVISGEIKTSDIEGLDEKLSKIGGTETIVGGKTWYIKDLKDVDLSGLTKNADGQYVLGSGSGGGGSVDSVNGQTGVVVLTKSDVGLSNVPNTDFTSAVSLNTAKVSYTDAAKVAGVEDGADVTDSNNVDAAGAVMESDYTTAHSVLVQQSGTGSPETIQVSNDTLIGRKTGGGADIESLTASEVRTIINVEDGATADQTDSEIAAAYRNEVGQVSGAEITAGTETDLRTYSPADVAAIVAAHGGGGGGSSAFPLSKINVYRLPELVSIGIKSNDMYYSQGINKIAKASRFSDNADFIPNDRNGANTYWTLGSNMYNFTSTPDDYLYYVSATGTFRRIDTTDKSEVLMTVVGGGCALYSPIANDGTYIYCIDNATANLKKYSVSGTTITFISTTVLPFANNSGRYHSMHIANGYLYYRAQPVVVTGNGSTVVKYKLSDGTYEEFSSYLNQSQPQYAIGRGNAIFDDGNFVYMAYVQHDSEDFIGSSLSVIDEL